ncbi:aminotransferase class I/II-fold pyridoxal phosphate-dependent enzyme [Salmonella enterica subsp. houtenae serovar 51:z4,z23:-]|nr:aminotransferase class I/II-fold pyridoxal phosphate-dependent enzyme [Salmonella enterica subsp. houtenae serovar 51:z4,z23:-]
MTSGDAYDHRYQHFTWHLPPADPQAWQAAAIALHHIFDAIFTNRIWLCRNPDVDPELFALLELAPLANVTVSLNACHERVIAASGGNLCEPGQDEHIIVCGEVVDRSMVTRWQPRTGLIVNTPANRDSVTVTWLQQRDVFHAPGFSDLLKLALYGMAQVSRQGVNNTTDIMEVIRSILYEPAAMSQYIETTGDLFIQRFSSLATATPDRLAIVAGEERYSYGELARITDSIAHDWRSLNLSKGDRVLVIVPRSPAIVAAVIAAFKAGLAICLIDPRQPDSYVETCCRIVGPALVINLTGRDLAFPGVSVVTTVNLAANDEAPPVRRDHFRADDCAIITLTSGTTREPKAVMGRYSSLTHFFDWMDSRLGPMADAAFGMCSSIGHDPLQRDIMTPLYLGGHIVIPGEHDLNEPQRLSRWLANKRIEFVCLNAALVPWLASSTRLPQLRALFCVGGALTRSQAVMLCQVIPNAQIVNLYGATETQRAVGFFTLPRDSDALAILPDVVPLGRGIKDVDLLVRDLSHPVLALPYQIGEIVLRSSYIALGYAGDPELSARKFRNDVIPGSNAIPAYLTGDLGYLSLYHGVVFTGRMDDQYKISGYRVELTAIDDMCRQHPHVKNAATLVVEVEGLPTLVACIVPDDVMMPKEVSGLRHWLSQRLPHYMVPHRFCVLSDLPLTLNRKVDMRVLADLAKLDIGMNDGNTAGSGAFTVKSREQIVAFVYQYTGQKNPRHDVALTFLGIDSLLFMALLSQLSCESGNPDGLHNGMSINEIVSALNGRSLPGSMQSAPCSTSQPDRPNWNEHSPRDLLGPAICVTETHISFARGELDHCCSNSYFGLAGHPTIRTQLAQFINEGQILGAHGSAELNGFTHWHEQLTTAISEIHNCEAVMLYGSGYLANISVIAAIVSAGDQLFVDENCHQSLIDGCRLSGAKISVYKHNDADDLEGLLLANPRSPNAVWAIVTEGVFSIEGDILALPAIHTLARRFDCRLIVDEACSLGLLGVDGTGVESHFGMPGAIDIRTATMGKALASTGGYVTCRTGDVMRLRFQRGASFSTSLSPLNAFISLQGAKLLLKEGKQLKLSLDRNTILWRESLNALGFDTGRSSTAIVPIMCADSKAVRALFLRALELGIYVLPVSPPWSKRVHAVRTSVTSAHEPDRLREIAARFTAGG